MGFDGGHNKSTNKIQLFLLIFNNGFTICILYGYMPVLSVTFIGVRKL